MCSEHCHDSHKHSPKKAASQLSAKAKLVIRLEHAVIHNKEHVKSFRNLADEAAKLGANETSRLILAAMEHAELQNQALEEGLAQLRY